MSEDLFWIAIDESRAAATATTDQGQKLTQILMVESPEDILTFDRIFWEKRMQLYTWDHWGVGYLLNGGCSDDCFEYYRCWIIGHGREFYENALRDPESVADKVSRSFFELPKPYENESLLQAPYLAYVGATGKEISPYGVTSVSVGESAMPSGKSWTEDELPKRFPKVYKKLHASPMPKIFLVCVLIFVVVPAVYRLSKAFLSS